MKKIYIAGCGGMLGEAFHRQFKKEYLLECSDIDVNEEWLSYLDFRILDDYLDAVKKFNPDFLFHLGAHTDLEYCEKNADDAYQTNTMSVENAVYISNQLNIPLIYISTAGIFDGKKQLYDDWDLPNPLGVYARSKYMGERFVIENSRKYIICRAGWMMGGGPAKDKKFVNKIMNQISSGKKVLNIVNDKDGTPTYTHDFAKTVKTLIENEYWGLYNCVCGGETSRIEVTQEILKVLRLSDNIEINEVTSEFFKDVYFAERPPSERLVNKKLCLRNIKVMRDWKVSLSEYLSQYYKDFI